LTELSDVEKTGSAEYSNVIGRGKLTVQYNASRSLTAVENWTVW